MAKITAIMKDEQTISVKQRAVDEVIITSLEGNVRPNGLDRSEFKIDWDIGYRDNSGLFVPLGSGEQSLIGDDAISLMATMPKTNETVWEATERAAVQWLESKGLL